MVRLSHPNIVKLLGVCFTDPMLLIMELCHLGPVNVYLQNHPMYPFSQMLNVITQVAEGMRYLESIKFVHRDLAARNVLMVDETKVKISDFGMSRALGIGSDYYKVSLFLCITLYYQ
ncbi:Tyrosine-protein kinase SYK-like [Oopsacas minuta]|uniref:Tyrosine-protein kinase SYK-like n=1 Tax=Oopsacas minuta TaxID=111878 RepID=A0AAV7K828_9METZ|nr:Tyrosine-protein kinase SYK-like [Oopsacas minuta]